MPDKILRSRPAEPGYSAHLLLAPIAFTCFAGALLTDIAYSRTADMQWANFSTWLLAFGLLFAAIAAVAGIVDLRRFPARSAAAMRVHVVGTVVVLILGLFNNFVHSRDAWTSVVPTGLLLSAATVAVMLATGWLGFRSVHHRNLGVKL